MTVGMVCKNLTCETHHCENETSKLTPTKPKPLPTDLAACPGGAANGIEAGRFHLHRAAPAAGQGLGCAISAPRSISAAVTAAVAAKQRLLGRASAL